MRKRWARWKARRAARRERRVYACPECGRVASIAEWVSRPICVHSWADSSPEIWDGDNCGADEGERIEEARNADWREPGPKTWTEMEPYR